MARGPISCNFRRLAVLCWFRDTKYLNETYSRPAYSPRIEQIFPLTMETFHMRKLLLMIAIVSPFALLPGAGSAKGCLKGAAVGGVVGHVAGHHAVAGAAVGCVIGHHRAKAKDDQAAQAPPQSQGKSPGQ